jgi:hypothetical protein
MDLKVQRLSQGEKIAAGSALALFICMFLGWFNFGFAVVNAWDSLHYVSPILAIAIITILAIAFLKASARSIGDVPTGSVIFALGCLAALLILFRLLDPISVGDASPFGGGAVEESGSAEAGLFLGLFAAIGIAVGGYIATGGRALEQVKKLFAGGAGPAPGQAPPPPPAGAVPPPGSPPAPEPVPSPAEPALPPLRHHAPLPPVETPLPPVTVPPSEARRAFCEHCGASVGAADRFCGGCGQATASR